MDITINMAKMEEICCRRKAKSLHIRGMEAEECGSHHKHCAKMEEICCRRKAKSSRISSVDVMEEDTP